MVEGVFPLNSLLFMMKYLCWWPSLIMCHSSNFVKCSEKPGLILLLHERTVPCAAKWRSSLDMAGAGGSRQLGSEQVEFSYNRFHFVLLNDFVEETKISLVSAYPVCIVFTACSFLSSPPPLTHKKRCYFGLSHRCGMHGGTTQGSKQNKVHHNSSSCTANLPV